LPRAATHVSDGIKQNECPIVGNLIEEADELRARVCLLAERLATYANAR